MIKIILNLNVLEITNTENNSILVVPASDYIVENFYITNILDKNLKEKTVRLISKYTNTDYTTFDINTLDPASTGYNTNLDIYTQSLSTLLSASNSSGGGSGTSGGGGSGTSGITNINSQSNSFQFLTTGNNGNDFNISSATGIHEFNIPTASATKRGLLDPTNWNIFNNKQAALSGNGFVKISGSIISYDSNTYLTDINGITAGGDLSGTYPNPTIASATFTNKGLLIASDYKKYLLSDLGGSLFTDNFTRADSASLGSNYTQSGSTMSILSNKLRMTNASGSLVWTNSAKVTGISPSNLENFEVSGTISIPTLSATTFGVSIGFESTTTPTYGQSFEIRFAMETANLGKILFYKNQSTLVSSISTTGSLTIAFGDNTSFKVVLNKNEVIVTWTNTTTNVSLTQTFVFELGRSTVVKAIMANTHYVTLFSHGGTIDIDDLAITSTTKKGGIWKLGDSITMGYSVGDISKRAVDVLNKNYVGNFIAFGAGNLRIQELTTCAAEIALHLPDEIIFAAGVNNIRAGESAATIAGRVATFLTTINSLTSNYYVVGVNFFVCGLVPQTLQDVTATNDLLASTYSSGYIDLYTSLRVSGTSAPNPSFYNVDGIHTNAYGDQRIVKSIVSKRGYSLRNYADINNHSLRTLENGYVVIGNNVTPQTLFDLVDTKSQLRVSNTTSDATDNGLYMMSLAGAGNIGYNVYYDGTNFIAKSADTSSITFGQNVLRFFASTGATIGTTVSQTQKMTITNTGIGIGNVAPVYGVDFIGADINGVLHINSTNTNDGGFIQAVPNGLVLGGNGYFNGSNFIARSTSPSSIAIQNGSVTIRCNSGAAIGSSYTLNEVARFTSDGRLGIGTITPSATLHLKAGTATANTAPLKFSSGILLTTAEAGAVEFLTDKFYGTITTSAARKEFIQGDNAISEGVNLILGTTTGTKIGTATNQKIGFFGVTPITQRPDSLDLGEVLAEFGLREVGTAYNLFTDGDIEFTSENILFNRIVSGIWNGTAISDSYISSATVWNNKQPFLGGTGLVKSDSGTISYISGTSSQFVKADGTLDSNSYITGISITNEASGSGTSTISLTLNNDAVISKLLTGFTSTTGTLSASDSILSAIQKLNGNIGLLSGAVVYQGVWNADTNTPTLVSSVGTKGHLYKVSVIGTTNLDGITDWNLGDNVVFNGTTWDKLDGAYNEVLSVNGDVGNIVLTGTTNRISVSGLNFDISSNYVGQTSITTLGTITSGTWNGSLISNIYGGTGTTTTFTEGSIVFSGASGIYSQDNSNLYWDNTNNRLGIGTNTPTANIDIVGDSINISKYSDDSIGSNITLRKSRGIVSIPLPLLSNDIISVFSGQGYGSTAFSSDKVSMVFGTNEVWTDLTQGTYISFNTTQTGTTNTSAILRIENSGLTISDTINIILGTTTGTSIGTTTSQKLAFYGSTPIIQQVASTDLGTVLSNLGLRAVGSTYTLTTSGSVSLSGGLEIVSTSLTITNQNIILGTTTGTSIGTSITQKLAFYGSTPIIQQVATTDLGVVLSNLGLRAVGSTYTLTTSGNVSFSNDITINHIIGGGLLPTGVAGAAAGTVATVLLTKQKDSSMVIQLTTSATGRVANAAVVNITFGRAYSSPPKVFLVPVNVNARGLNGGTLVYVPETSITINGFSIFAGSTVLGSVVVYQWSAFIIQ